MSGNENTPSDKARDIITGRDYRLIALWAVCLGLLYALGGGFGVHLLRSYKAQTTRYRQDWIKSSSVGPAVETSDLVSPDETKPVEVKVGIYINHLGEYSLDDRRLTADFDVWFSWMGDEVHPGETFEIVDGQVEQQEKIESHSQDGRRYERYRVRARILKLIDASRLPFNDEELGIRIEEKVNRVNRLRYVADREKTGIDPQAIRRLFRITASAAFVKDHARAADRNVHSRFIYVMLLSPLGTGFYVKMFQGLFASVAIALMALFIEPTHFAPKFGLGIGALFSLIGNNISLGTNLLVSNRLSLTDMVTGIGLVTIFLMLTESAISLHIHASRGRKKLSRLLDKTTFAVLSLGYVIVNLALPLAAKS